jgi:uncharacterized membrane protein
MNLKLIAVGFIIIIIGVVSLVLFGQSSELNYPESWCSAQTHITPLSWLTFSTLSQCLIILGIVLIVMGIFHDKIMGTPSRKDHAALITTPRWVLREMVSYDFDPKKDPPVDNIVYRYEGKEYVFKIASIEVMEARE